MSPNYLIELITFLQSVISEEFNLLLVEPNQILKQEICMQLTLEESVQVKLLKAQTVVW